MELALHALATDILTIIEDKRLEFETLAQLEDGDEELILKETLIDFLKQAIADGRLLIRSS